MNFITFTTILISTIFVHTSQIMAQSRFQDAKVGGAPIHIHKPTRVDQSRPELPSQLILKDLNHQDVLQVVGNPIGETQYLIITHPNWFGIWRFVRH